MNFDTTYLQSLFLKSPKQLCQHALALTDSDADEFWFVCGVIDAQSGKVLTDLRAASRTHDLSVGREILRKLETIL